jgi:hypothetical protein
VALSLSKLVPSPPRQSIRFGYVCSRALTHLFLPRTTSALTPLLGSGPHPKCGDAGYVSWRQTWVRVITSANASRYFGKPQYCTYNFNARPSTSYTPHASLLRCSIARNVCRFYRTLRATSRPNITRAAVNLRKRKRESPLPTLPPWEGDTIAVTPRRTVTGQVSGERAPLRDTQRGNEAPQSRIASRIESMCLP